MSKKAYLVVSGCYSDFSVHGVCSTREIADEMAKHFCADIWSPASVVEMEMDKIPDHPPGMYRFSVSMDKEGGSSAYQVNSDEEYGDDFFFDSTASEPGGEIVCHLWATDKEHAVKIVNERRIMMLAEGLWSCDGFNKIKKRGWK